ncbi:bifunctional folylpolyglutamate synthase/dihydrofolate synthase [Tepidibacter formicigenes]|jgi:dihydrofolate synthase/folylpolyglutamate synthase|uniref:Dihydrofolate synthase/folylpolyglutamate synthase n=1 Tax=Tepidibacter formicigenes DSM 15518 TaxID=1123349 RepID=A0A1M6L9K0_9FIRM|nr:folylpolyglutamate synthase/dihydrofolate synthase family protein [Tepidibacter formicigenes]SHJ67866.1 dihydrofolate synthase / folylpolyglutamate synthase [Tepidibacter formicigenes DSM 15518]
MNYNEALEYIHGTYKFGRKLGLDNITKLLELLGNPHEDLNVIHVAGTNGKGSTCSFISSILVNQGYNVGLYTSPYLETFTERIRINGENIKEEELARVTQIVKEKVQVMVNRGYNHPTEFEIVTAIAFYYYKEQNVDFLVLEVGMGGRFDATNVVKKPLICVITPISMDHTDYLGDTLGKIAYEKGGIIKENCDVVMYPQEKEAEDVIKDLVQEKNSILTTANIKDKEIIKGDIYGQTFNLNLNNENYERLEIKLIGDHQVNNAILALNVINILKNKYDFEINKQSIYKGLKETKWPGRIELLMEKPLFIIDGAHNKDGAISLTNSIDKYLNNKNITLLIGMLKDKDVDSVLKVLIPKCSKIITTTPDSDRALTAKDLKEKIIDLGKECISINDIEDAVKLSINECKEDEIIICAGSLYMIGAVRSIIKKGDI